MIRNRTPRARRGTAWSVAAIAAMLLPGAALADSVSLQWTAPGDDGNVGRASAYELRYSTRPIAGTDTTSWWVAATSAGSLPAPQTAGSRESYSVNGLTTGTTYYFIIRTADEVPNWSGYSNVIPKVPGAPTGGLATVSGLNASVVANGVSLAWQQPAAGSGSGYHVYRRTGAGGTDALLGTAPVDQTSFTDTTAAGGATYEYLVATYQGTSEGTPAVVTVTVPSAGLAAADPSIHGYPNPARGRVTFRFDGGTKEGAPGHVRLTVFDMSGRQICRVLDTTVDPGARTVDWLCRSDKGNPVAPGLYTAILDGPQGRSVMRLAIVP